MEENKEKMSEKDSQALSDIAKFVYLQSGNKKTLNDVEEEIGKSYRNMQIKLKEKLAPIINNLIVSRVDPSIINILENEVRDNARKSFYNSILNSDISEINRIQDIVVSESIKSVIPLEYGESIIQDSPSNLSNIEIGELLEKDNSNELQGLEKEKILDTIKLGDGTEIVVIAPEDPIYDFIDEQDLNDEEIIESKQYEIKIAYEKGDLKSIEKTLSSTERGLAFDSVFRFLNTRFDKSNENIKNDDYEDNKSKGVYEVFKLAYEKTKDGTRERQGYIEDAYTIVEKLKFITNVTDPSTSIDKKERDEIIKRFKEIEPKVFAIYEKYPNIIKKLEIYYGELYTNNIGAKLAERKRLSEKEVIDKIIAISKELETQETIDENNSEKMEAQGSKISEENSTNKAYIPQEQDILEDINIQAEKVEKVISQSEKTQHGKVSSTEKQIVSNAEKINKLKGVLSGMFNSGNLKVMENFVLNQLEKQNSDIAPAILEFLDSKEKNENFYTESSVSFRKKIFTAIIDSEVVTEKDFELMGKIDSTISKEILQEMIEQQNQGKLSVKKTNSIVLLGKNVNKDSEKKESLFIADNIITDGVRLIDNKSITGPNTEEGPEL